MFCGCFGFCSSKKAWCETRVLRKRGERGGWRRGGESWGDAGARRRPLRSLAVVYLPPAPSTPKFTSRSLPLPHPPIDKACILQPIAVRRRA